MIQAKQTDKESGMKIEEYAENRDGRVKLAKVHDENFARGNGRRH